MLKRNRVSGIKLQHGQTKVTSFLSSTSICSMKSVPTTDLELDTIGCTSNEGRFQLKKTRISTVECCVCNATVDADNDFYNLHLNACLDRQRLRQSQSLNSTKKNMSEQPSSFFYSVDQIIFLKELPGLIIIYDFIDATMEKILIDRLDDDKGTPWEMSSRNGHCDSKHYGVKTQFGRGISKEIRAVRKHDESKGEQDVPGFMDCCLERFQDLRRYLTLTIARGDDIYFSNALKILREFSPNECNANSYQRCRKDYLAAHYDDRELSGPVLMNLSLGGVASMCYSKTGEKDVMVELPRRSLQLVTGDARYRWTHSIPASSILDERRVSITWRQVGAGKKSLSL